MVNIIKLIRIASEIICFKIKFNIIYIFFAQIKLWVIVPFIELIILIISPKLIMMIN